MKKTICFAYYADGKFIGWYGDSWGSVAKYPKIYTNSGKQIAIITKNLHSKLKKINESSFEEESKNVSGISAIPLLIYTDEELLRNKEVELRIVECPEYDGPDPDFDGDKWDIEMEDYRKAFEKAGISNIPGPSVERMKAVTEFHKTYPAPTPGNWIYADYEKVKTWAVTEPTTFIGVIK